MQYAMQVYWLLLAQTVSNAEKFFPPMYAMDNLVKCHNQNRTFCEAEISLKSNDLNSVVWQKILESNKPMYTLDRSKLYRALCVPHDHPDDEKIIQNQITSRLNSELSNYSLEVDFVKIHICTVPKEKKLTLVQQILIFLFFLYISIIIYSTYFDLKVGKNRLFEAFSIISNNAQLMKINSNNNYQKMKSIQGIRTLFAMLVVTGHTLLATFFSYTSNPEFLEIGAKETAKWFGSFSMLFVQPFFVITGWITMDFMLEQLKKKKKVTITDILGVIIIRILRIWPCLIFTVLLHYSGMSLYIFNSSHQLFMYADVNNCRERWWMTIFFLANWLPTKDTCCLHTWYLAADFQIFICSILFLYTIFKFEYPLLRSCLILFGVVVLGFMFQLYYNEIGVMFRLEPKQLQIYRMWSQYNAHMNIWYISTLSNMPSFLLGLIFGVIYNRRGDRKYFQHIIMKLVWGVLFFGLPSCAVYLGGYDYDRVASALLGSILKPMMSLGIAIGILGFSEGLGGILKQILECRFLEILSNVTYYVYLVHVTFAIAPLLLLTVPEELSWPKLLFRSFINIILSFIAGYIGTILIELPWKNVINLLIKGEKTKSG